MPDREAGRIRDASTVVTLCSTIQICRWIRPEFWMPCSTRSSPLRWQNRRRSRNAASRSLSRTNSRAVIGFRRRGCGRSVPGRSWRRRSRGDRAPNGSNREKRWTRTRRKNGLAAAVARGVAAAAVAEIRSQPKKEFANPPREEEFEEEDVAEPRGSAAPVRDSRAAEELDEDEELEDEDRFDGDEEDEEEGSGERLKLKHKKIPTWQQAVDAIIAVNMESRAKNPSGGGGGGRGRGRRWRK